MKAFAWIVGAAALAGACSVLSAGTAFVLTRQAGSRQAGRLAAALERIDQLEASQAVMKVHERHRRAREEQDDAIRRVAAGAADRCAADSGIRHRMTPEHWGLIHRRTDSWIVEGCTLEGGQGAIPYANFWSIEIRAADAEPQGVGEPYRAESIVWNLEEARPDRFGHWSFVRKIEMEVKPLWPKLDFP